MKFEEARLDLVPRSVGNCLDLALLICGRHLGALVGLWALFAVPLGAAAYVAARQTEWGLLITAALGFLGTGPFGVLLIGGMARTAFGEEITLPKIVSNVRTDYRLLLDVFGRRFAIACASLFCFIPGAFLALRWSFLVESQVLGRLHAHQHDRRTKELIQLEFSDLCVRAAAIGIAGLIGWWLLEMTTDVVWTILFGRSLFLGRLSEVGGIAGHETFDEFAFGQWVHHVWSLATSDPAVLALHLATGLAVYAVCRIAWFLCYIDLRVRRDCWDLDLEILDESRRL